MKQGDDQLTNGDELPKPVKRNAKKTRASDDEPRKNKNEPKTQTLTLERARAALIYLQQMVAGYEVHQACEVQVRGPGAVVSDPHDANDASMAAEDIAALNRIVDDALYNQKRRLKRRREFLVASAARHFQHLHQAATQPDAAMKLDVNALKIIGFELGVTTNATEEEEMMGQIEGLSADPVGWSATTVASLVGRDPRSVCKTIATQTSKTAPRLTHWADAIAGPFGSCLDELDACRYATRLTELRNAAVEELGMPSWRELDGLSGSAARRLQHHWSPVFREIAKDDSLALADSPLAAKLTPGELLTVARKSRAACEEITSFFRGHPDVSSEAFDAAIPGFSNRMRKVLTLPEKDPEHVRELGQLQLELRRIIERSIARCLGIEV